MEALAAKGRRRRSQRGRGGRKDEAAAEADDGDQRGEAAEDQHDRLWYLISRAPAGSPSTPLMKLPIARTAKPMAMTIGIAFGSDAVDRRELQACWCPRR